MNHQFTEEGFAALKRKWPLAHQGVIDEKDWTLLECWLEDHDKKLLAHIREEVEKMRDIQHVREWWCKTQEHGYIKDYFSHNDSQFCPDCGKRLEEKEYDKDAYTHKNEVLDDVLALLT